MHRATIAFAALFGLALIASLVPEPAAAQWTAAQRAACEGDARRLCSQFLANPSGLNSCMQSNASRVSSRCRAAMGGKKKKKTG
jgi:hypothetical protein